MSVFNKSELVQIIVIKMAAKIGKLECMYTTWSHKYHTASNTGFLLVILVSFLQPYDEAYLKSTDPPIKFLSFHSYTRKLTSGVDK